MCTRLGPWNTARSTNTTVEHASEGVRETKPPLRLQPGTGPCGCGCRGRTGLAGNRGLPLSLLLRRLGPSRGRRAGPSGCVCNRLVHSGPLGLRQRPAGSYRHWVRGLQIHSEDGGGAGDCLEAEDDAAKGDVAAVCTAGQPCYIRTHTHTRTHARRVPTQQHPHRGGAGARR